MFNIQRLKFDSSNCSYFSLPYKLHFFAVGTVVVQPVLEVYTLQLNCFLHAYCLTERYWHCSHSFTVTREEVTEN